ncbi:SatD family protein [Microbacterium koreense]|uniref:SatD family protein n=1 Tax=Microbacterium koreense TaxID=323761 RepID=A0ABW2ZTS5_9MICO
MVAAVIADIVRSRELDDRPSAQRALEATLGRVAETGPSALRPLVPTVGDELQGVFGELSAALATTMLLQLALPEELELRFGIGLGRIEEVPSMSGPLSEGEAWWAARAAIDAVETLAQRAAPSARTRVAVPAGASDDVLELVRVANAGVLARDRALARLSARNRRLIHGRWLGLTQAELAEQEGVGQSAVSQALSTADAGALLEGLRELTDRAE